MHEKNLELLRAGVFNAWTEKSLGRLARADAGRYAKNEMSSGFLGSIDSYAYRSPAATMPVAGADRRPTPAPAQPHRAGRAGAGTRGADDARSRTPTEPTK